MGDQRKPGRGQGASGMKPPAGKEPAGEQPAEVKFDLWFIYRLLSGGIGSVATLILAGIGLPSIALLAFFATVGLLTILLVKNEKMTGREARFLWTGLAVLALVYLVLLAFPMKVMSRVVNSKLTPIPDYPLELSDSGLVSHSGNTGPNGEFVVNNVPSGRFIISSKGNLMAVGSARSWGERALHFNVLDAGDLVVNASPTQPAPSITIPPTLTPTPIRTATMPPTPTTTPSPTPAATATLEPVWKVNLADNNSVAQTETLIVEYTGHLDGFLWVFVMNQDSNRYYTQSANPCIGLSAFQAGNKWEIRVGFGAPGSQNSGKRFDIVLAVAKTELDNQFIAGRLVSWCNTQNFAGFEILPDEVREVYRVRDLTRTEQNYGAAPDITNTRVSGQVKITSLSDGSQVPDEVSLSGSYSDLAPGSEIWTLVFPGYGIWYPQSRQGAETCNANQVTLDTNSHTWQTAARFGNDSSKTFDVVTVLANKEASEFLRVRQQVWCRAGNYFGFHTIELPQGIEEKDHIRVTR